MNLISEIDMTHAYKRNLKIRDEFEIKQNNLMIITKQKQDKELWL